MYRIFYAERDTTLYEKYPEQNTGIDQILELTKVASGSKLNGTIQANQYNTRFLIDFGKQITTLSQSISDGVIPQITNNHADSASVFLSIKAADASDLLHSYSIEVFPVSESWINGNGNYSDIPIQRYGSSWYYRDSDDIGTGWDTGSAHSRFTSIGTTNSQGGGAWITGSEYGMSQSFSNESPDLRVDITDIVKNMITGSDSAGYISNNGFIVKRPYSDEISDEVLGSIKFFGRESHTIFVPKLEVQWNNATQPADYTSLTEISADTYVPYIKNIKSEYRTSEQTKFRIGVRPEFPSKAFQTSSFYLTGERLPTSSFYSIIDSVTNETILPFHASASIIDGDSNGSFFKLRMDSFMPERYYKIMLKIERTDDIQTFDDFYFKVVN